MEKESKLEKEERSQGWIDQAFHSSVKKNLREASVLFYPFTFFFLHTHIIHKG